jgi:hypothetical protein
MYEGRTLRSFFHVASAPVNKYLYNHMIIGGNDAADGDSVSRGQLAHFHTLPELSNSTRFFKGASRLN